MAEPTRSQEMGARMIVHVLVKLQNEEGAASAIEMVKLALEQWGYSKTLTIETLCGVQKARDAMH